MPLKLMQLAHYHRALSLVVSDNVLHIRGSGHARPMNYTGVYYKSKIKLGVVEIFVSISCTYITTMVVKQQQGCLYTHIVMKF